MHAKARPTAVLLYGALLAHTVVSAANYLFAKRALIEIPALPLGLLRFVGASALLVLLLRRALPKGKRMPPRHARRKLLVLSVLCVPVNQGFFLYGLQLSTAAHAALIYTLTPVFVLLLAQALIGEFPGWRASFGTVLALGGTLYVLLHGGTATWGEPLLGDLLLLIAVIAWSLYTAEGRAIVGELGSLPTIAWTIICGTILYLPLGLGALLVPSYRADIAHASPQAWFGVAYLIVMTSVVSYLIWSWALSHLAAARVAVFTNLQPLVTALLAQAFLGERVTLTFYAAAAVVIAGVLLTQWRTTDMAEETLLESPGHP
jgi:drug/metabolite transporter (DMT)-like permease